MHDKQLRLITIMSLIMVHFLIIASVFGAFVDITYARDVPSMATQGVEQAKERH